MTVWRAGISALTVFAGTSLITSGLVSALLAGTPVTQSAYTTAATNTCGQHPATTALSSVAVSSALVRLDSASSAQLIAAATPTPSITAATATATASTPAAAPSGSATAQASPTASSASPSASTTPSPTPSPSKSPTPTPTPTPTASSPAVQLCVSVQAVATSVQPGGTASFAVWVWPSGGTAKSITVTASAKVTAAITPRFSVCLPPGGATCTVATLAAGQADELLAAVTVPKTAKTGQRATLTATAKATGATAAAPASASATISTTASAKPTATSGRASSGSGGIPSGLGATLPGGIPPLTPAGIAASAAALPFLPSPTDPGGLFPTVTPAATPNVGTGALPNPAGAPVTDTSDSLPLSTRLLGGQVLGLAVLAVALVIAIARLSLREPRRQHGKDPAP